MSEGRPPPGQDPARGLRHIGTALLGFEAFTVALAILGTRDPGHGFPALPVTLLAALAVVLMVTAAQLGRAWAITAGTALQVLVFAAGILAWPLYLLAVIFGALWFGYLRMRRDLTSIASRAS